MRIQWFPGHMAKAKKLLAEMIPLVDLVIELRDARIPLSSGNPVLATLLGPKKRLIVLTKPDLADDRRTRDFIALFTRDNVPALAVNTQDRSSVKQLARHVRHAGMGVVPRDRVRDAALRLPRVMVAGIPNVGKSSLINALSGRRATLTGALPGLTRSKQWVRVDSEFEILDTPGLLWPQLDDPSIAFKLAVTGAIGEGGFDRLDLADGLIAFLANEYPEALQLRYGVPVGSPPDAVAIALAIGHRRGCLLPGGQVDRLRVADMLLTEFRMGKTGRFTLDRE